MLPDDTWQTVYTLNSFFVLWIHKISAIDNLENHHAMLEIYIGHYKNLTSCQQKAVTDLTVNRYLEDYYYISDWLKTELKLIPGTRAFKKIYREHVEKVTTAFSLYDDHTYISAIFYKSHKHPPIALSTARNIHGSRKDVMLADSIGSQTASIPTHKLLQSFSYPDLQYFKADRVSEAEVCECSRRATINRQQIRQLIGKGVIGAVDARHFFRHCTDHILVAHCKFLQQNTKACIFNMRPFHTHSFIVRGIQFIPLFTEGVEPTQFALDNKKTVLAPLFAKWPGELQKISQGILEKYSVSEAIKHLWQNFISTHINLRGWKSCNIPLPFLLVFDEQWYSFIKRIERELYKESMLFKYNLNNNIDETENAMQHQYTRQVA